MDAAGGFRRIDDEGNAGATVPADVKPRLSHIWKLSPETAEFGRLGAFEPLQDRGLLQFWGSTARLEFCRESGDYWGGHFVVPDYLSSRMEGDARLKKCLSMGVTHLAPEDPQSTATANGERKSDKQPTMEADVLWGRLKGVDAACLSCRVARRHHEPNWSCHHRRVCVGAARK